MVRTELKEDYIVICNEHYGLTVIYNVSSIYNCYFAYGTIFKALNTCPDIYNCNVIRIVM